MERFQEHDVKGPKSKTKRGRRELYLEGKRHTHHGKERKYIKSPLPRAKCERVNNIAPRILPF